MGASVLLSCAVYHELLRKYAYIILYMLDAYGGNDRPFVRPPRTRHILSCAFTYVSPSYIPQASNLCLCASLLLFGPVSPRSSYASDRARVTHCPRCHDKYFRDSFSALWVRERARELSPGYDQKHITMKKMYMGEKENERKRVLRE